VRPISPLRSLRNCGAVRLYPLGIHEEVVLIPAGTDLSPAMKSGLGLGEAQCWGPRSAILSVRWGAWCYGVMVLAGFWAWGLGRGPASLRGAGRWWGGSGRWSLGTLWRGYRSEAWGAGEFRPIFAPTRGGWPKKEALLAGMATPCAGRCADSGVWTLLRILRQFGRLRTGTLATTKQPNSRGRG